MTDWERCPAVERRPGKLSGAWTFAGTRVPVSPSSRTLKAARRLASFWIGSRALKPGRFERCWNTKRRPCEFPRNCELLFDQGQPRAAAPTSRRSCRGHGGRARLVRSG